jgi:hypothetical protein
MHAETDEELRSEADHLLDSGLRQVLTDFGEVHIIGSYALHLMAWRDLDIHIVRRVVDPITFFDLGGRIASLLKPHRMHYRDETVAATPGLPKGLYWGVYLGDERDGAWKIDVWVSEPEIFESTRAYCEQIAARLSESSRPTILRIKSACWRHPEYRRRFSSSDIYSAVLEHGVTNIEGFWAFLKERNCTV